MIDIAATIKVFGYNPSRFCETSPRPVIWKCPQCKVSRQYSFTVAHKKDTGPTDHARCQRCLNSYRLGKTYPRKSTTVALPLPPEVDAEETLKQFGYRPEEIRPWSRKRVVVRCAVTGALHTPTRFSLNANQHIRDTGHYVSLSAIVSERRRGYRASAETRARMSAGVKRAKARKPVQSQPSASDRELIKKVVAENAAKYARRKQIA